MITSTNQVRHLYVANALKTAVANSDAAGTIAVKVDNKKENLYFQYKGADNVLRSDLIPIASITHAKATKAESMAHTMKAVLVTLDKNVNEGDPVAGEDYLLRIAFRQFLGMSDEDVYFKYGMVHAYKGLTTSDFYKTLVISLVKNFSREPVALVKFALKTADGTVDVDSQTKESELDGTYTGIIITEVEQEWILGTKDQVPVYFSVHSDAITVDGEERYWGTVEDVDSKESINNGKQIANLEYFLLGERGDIYRNISWPNVIPTKYLVDPTKPYDTIDIHYSFSGEGVHVHKSEKDITLVVPQKTAGDYTDVNAIISAINTATGLNIEVLK